MGWPRRHLLQFSDQLLVFAPTRFSKASYQLRGREIVDRLNLDDGSLAGVLANGYCQPFEAFLIGWIVRKQVTGVAERYGAVVLQLSPNLHPLACPFCGQSKGQQQPRRALLNARYSHFIRMLYIEQLEVNPMK